LYELSAQFQGVPADPVIFKAAARPQGSCEFFCHQYHYDQRLPGANNGACLDACAGGVMTMWNGRPIFWMLMLWTGAIAVLCAVDPDVAVTGFIQSVPSLSVPATALGLTLITAANRDRQ